MKIEHHLCMVMNMFRSDLEPLNKRTIEVTLRKVIVK